MRGAGIAITLLVVVLAIAPATPLGGDVIQRADSVGSLEQDRSTQARVLSLTMVPGLLANPFGQGIGSAGEASRLASSQPLRASDNSYLSLLFQLGVVGTLLVIAAVAVAAAPLRRAFHRGGRRQEAALLLAMLVFVLIVSFAGDVFYGSGGAMGWYLLGWVIALAGAPVRPLREAGIADSSRP